MAANLESVLGYKALLGFIETVKTGLPMVFPRELFTRTQNVIGFTGQYTQAAGTRKTAKIVPYGTASTQRPLKGIERRDVVLMHSIENIAIDPNLLDRLRGYATYEREGATQEIARQVKQKVALQHNLREAAWASLLALGAIHVDSSNNLLPSSSGAAITMDAQLTASHNGDLTTLLGSGNWGDWSSASSNIPRFITALKDQSVRDTGHEIEYAYYTRNISQYLYQNNFVKDALVRSGSPNMHYLMSGTVPDGTLGIKHWIPVSKFFYEDDNDSKQTIFQDDYVTFTPGLAADWYGFLEGSYQVPKKLSVGTDAADMLANFDQVFGMFSFATMSLNPPGIVMHTGDTFAPVIKNKDAVYIANTTP